MRNEKSLIIESVRAALPSAKLEWADVQSDDAPKGAMCPDACGTLILENDINLSVCFEAGAFPTLASLEERVRELKTAAGNLDALRALGAEPVDRGANINLRCPAYPVSFFYGMQVVDGVPIASDMQLYLDLCCQPQRGREAAEHLLSTRIGPLLQGGVERRALFSMRCCVSA